MLWIPLSIGSYFLNAVAATVDKFLLEKRIPEPLCYALYTGLLSIGVVILIPFGFTLLPIPVMLIAFGSGAALLVALYFFYSGLRVGDTSRVVPLVGGASPAFILLLSVLVLGEFITRGEVIAILFFIVGGALLARDSSSEKEYNTQLVFYALLSALFFAVTFFLTKEVFKMAPFFPGFIWTRLGSFIAALVVLFLPGVWPKMCKSKSSTSNGSMVLFITNKIIGAGGFFILNMAIAEGPVSIVNALKGIEHLFVFLIAVAVSFFAPRLIQESFAQKDLFEKVFGMVLMGIGFVFLFV